MYCSHLVVQWSIGDPSRTRLLHAYTWWQCLHHFMQYDSFIIIIIFMLSLTLSLSLWLLSSLSRCSYWFAFAPCFIRNSITIFNRSMQFTSVSTQMRTYWLHVFCANRSLATSVIVYNLHPSSYGSCNWLRFSLAFAQLAIRNSLLLILWFILIPYSHRSTLITFLYIPFILQTGNLAQTFMRNLRRLIHPSIVS